MDRTRRELLRGKVRKFARRDMVTVTKWEHNFVQNTWAEVTKTIPRDDRFLACGQRAAQGQTVTLRGVAQNGRAGFGNLQACGSVWSCPCCAAKIMKQRSTDLGNVLAWARRERHTIALITLTMRHHRPDRLDELWALLSKAWGRVTSGSGWVSETPERYAEARDDWEARRDLAARGLGRWPAGARSGKPFRARRIGDQERHGVLGFARAVEVTNGSHGWHPHVHAVVILENKTGGSEGQFNGYRAAKDLGASMFERWARAFPEEHRPDRDSGGLDVTVSMAAEKKLAEYLTKDGLLDSAEHVTASMDSAAHAVAMEATHGQAKRGRRKGRTPFQVLGDLDFDVQPRNHADRDLAIWHEWLDASAGKRQITWSVGLRELAGLAEVELTDEELAEQQDGADVVLTLPPVTWRAVRRESWLLLDLIERDGLRAVTDYLDQWVHPDTGEVGLEYGHPSYERMTDWATGDTPPFGDEFAA